MKKKILFNVLIIAALFLALVAPGVFAAPDGDRADYDNPEVSDQRLDNRTDPLTTMQLQLKEKAQEALLIGKAHGHTYAVAKGQYVELEREGEGTLWTVLGDFSDFPHNSIAEPDRDFDNTTIWTPDFNRDYYMTMLFDEGPGVNSMRQFYIEQSSNRYTVNGDVTDWVTVPGEAATYDDDLTVDVSPEHPYGGNAVWYFLMDQVNGWYDAQIEAGKTPAEINDYLSQFDIWDRYDFDGDGNFDEPDGYIDTFQSVHAGEGNEAGGGVLGDAAIWSHSWYAFSSLIGTVGPDFNMLGGIQIGDSDFWVGKYTIQPENGGVGVFAHEYGHDLGLPDLYDTSGGENSTGFWTLMSSGSWLNDGTVDIGSKPNHMGVWEKFQLGWLNYEVAYAGQTSSVKIGPAETNTKQAQGLFVVLPKKEVTTDIGTAFEGELYYYSGAGDDLDNFMYLPSINLAAGSTLSAKVNYSIELDWDYAYLVVSTDGGATWMPVETNVSSTDDPNGQNFGFGITGSSGGWVDLTADLSAFSGDVALGFRYWTDGNTGGFGFKVDNIQISGFPLDGAEEGARNEWTFDGFLITNGIESALFNHYYVAEFRQYRGFDSTLATGPYNFGFAAPYGNLVEHFPYQDGLLIHYWDTSQRNNNTRQHPGMGLILPIDAHPELLLNGSGTVWRGRMQTYDSTFGLDKTDEVCLHIGGVEQPCFGNLQANRVFDDSNSYWFPADASTGNLGRFSVIVPNTGTTIRVVSLSARDSFMQVQVKPK